jgi:hypothetical protein
VSACAGIYCLFKVAPSPERVAAVQAAIWERVEVDGLDLKERNHGYGQLKEAELQGVSAFQLDGFLSAFDGRFFKISYLTRWWSVDYPEGPMGEYVITMLTLLAQDDVEAVGYAPDEDSHIHALTKADVHQMLDDFIRVGWK